MHCSQDHGITEHENVQSVWLELKIPNKKTKLLCNYYREWCHNSTANQLEALNLFTKQINQINNRSSEVDIVIVGDMNLDLTRSQDKLYQNKQMAAKLISEFQQLGLNYLSPGQTFNQERKSKKISSTLDYIITNMAQSVTEMKNIATGISDHNVVIGCLKILQNDKQKTVTYRKPIKDIKQFKYDLANQAWEKLLGSENPNDQLQTFYEFYNQVLDKHSPYVTKTLRKNKRCPLSLETKSAMRNRDKLKKDLVSLTGAERMIKLSQFKKERNRVITLVRRDEKENFRKLINDAGYSNPWKPINELLKVKKEVSYPLVKENVKMTSNFEKAEMLNKTFISKVERIKQSIQADDEDPCKHLEARRLKHGLFSFKPVTEIIVRKHIKKLKNTNSTGIDGLKTKDVKMFTDELIVPLTHIINTSLVTGVYPELLKTSLVTAIHKKESRCNPENYRPISGLSVLSKLLEGIAEVQLRKYFESHELLPLSQHGYRKNRSTTSAILHLTNYLCQQKQQGFWTGVSMVDLSAAYDCVDHNILLKKLKIYGLSTKSLDWIRSFITERKQMVRIEGIHSECLPLKWGVPQGSCLSPLLYLIYTADIDNAIPEGEPCGYADDYSVSQSFKNPRLVISKTEEMVEKLIKYFSRLGLAMNPSKTEFMMFRPTRDPNKYEINIRSSTIQENYSVKLLGVTLTNDLCMSSHLENIYQIITQRTGLISRLRYKLDKKELTSIVHGIIISQVKYCLSAFSSVRMCEDNPRKESLEKIQVLLNNVARIINNIKRSDHFPIKELHKLSPWISLNHMSITSQICDTWRALNDPKLGTFYSKEYNKNTRAASNELLKPSQQEASSFVKGGISLLNDERFRCVRNFQNISLVKRHIRNNLNSFPM